MFLLFQTLFGILVLLMQKDALYVKSSFFQPGVYRTPNVADDCFQSKLHT